MTTRSYRREIADFKKGMSCRLDDNVLPMTVARRAYNFDTRSGALVDGLGVGALPTQKPLEREGVKAVWHYRKTTDGVTDDRLVAYDGSALYAACLYGESAEWTRLANAEFSSAPVAINYNLNSEDVIIFCSAQDGMLVWNGIDEPYRVDSAPEFASVCVHYERMWAVAEGDRDCVWFSSELDPTAWDVSLSGAGFISMRDERGKMLRIVSFLDYLYVFREYGITRISAYADQTQFGVSHLFTSSGRIYGDTVCICGDRIIFCASDGVYVFDGVATTRVLSHLSSGIRAERASSAYCNGWYYVCCEYDFGDGGATDVVLAYEVLTGDTLFLRGAGVTALTRIASKDYAFVAVVAQERLGAIDYSGAIFGAPTPKLWTSPFSDLGRQDKWKHLKEMYLTTHAPLTVTVCRDGEEEEYHLQGSTLPQRIRLRGKVGRVSFTFESHGVGTYVTHPVLIYTV